MCIYVKFVFVARLSLNACDAAANKIFIVTALHRTCAYNNKLNVTDMVVFPFIEYKWESLWCKVYLY